jgi:hypothetical protein
MEKQSSGPKGHVNNCRVVGRGGKTMINGDERVKGKNKVKKVKVKLSLCLTN